MGVLNSGRALGRRYRRHPRLLLASSSIVDTASASQLPTWKLIPYACQQWSASTRTSLAPSPSVPYTRSFHNPSWYTRNPLSFPKLSYSTFDSWLERYFPWLWLAKLYFLDWRKRSLSVRVLRLVSSDWCVLGRNPMESFLMERPWSSMALSTRIRFICSIDEI